MLKAQTILFTLSCLQEGVRLGRAEAKRQRQHHASIEANLAARWR